MGIRRSLVIGYGTRLSCLLSVLFRFYISSLLSTSFCMQKANETVLSTTVICPLISLSHSVKFHLHYTHPINAKTPHLPHLATILPPTFRIQRHPKIGDLINQMATVS